MRTGEVVQLGRRSGCSGGLFFCLVDGILIRQDNLFPEMAWPGIEEVHIEPHFNPRADFADANRPVEIEPSVSAVEAVLRASTGGAR